jgi:hypothetical protein
MIKFRLKTEYYIIIIAIAIKLVFQFIATSNSGFHSDEVMHVEAGHHLAFGYMDFPPFIGFLSWIQNIFQSNSLFINHLFNYLNSALILWICGLITIRVGGGVLAVLLTESAIIFSPGFAATQYLFAPTAFEQLFWVINIYFLILFCISPKSKYLIFISLFGALGLMTKYSIVFLLAGIVISVLFFKRELLGKRITWISVLLFILLVLPNVCWQIINEFPILGHMSELYKSQLNQLSFTKELALLFFFINPLTIILWFSALIVVPFHPKFKKYRLALYALIFSSILLLITRGKSYYYFSIILPLIAIGAVFVEFLLKNKKWIGYGYLALMIFLGLYLLPHGIPILKLEKYIEIYHLKTNNEGKIPLALDNYYSQENWNKIIVSVSKNYNALSDDEKENCYIWGKHYGMAGYVNLLRTKYHLPYAFSFHSAFYTWVPHFDKNIICIVISDSSVQKDYWSQYFEEVKEVDVIENKYASEESWNNYRLYVCKKIKYDSKKLKEIFKKDIF